MNQRNLENDNRPTVLVISPGGLMPIQGGGATRTWAIIDHLRNIGFRVELVTAGHGEHNAEIEIRVDRLWVQKPSRGKQKPTQSPVVFFREAMKHPFSTAKSMAGILRRRWQKRCEIWDGTSILKRNRRPGIEALAGVAAYSTRPVAAITIFAWMAPVLDRMPPGTLRILDTIDVQHTRCEIAKSAGGDLSHLSCSRKEEIRELTRADVLLAIQSEEMKVLTEMCPDHLIYLVGHAVAMKEFHPSSPFSHEILCVGNYYDPNVCGLRQFLKETWPFVRHAVPDARLLVCGRVGEGVRLAPRGVSIEGVVSDLDSYYHRSAVVINPVTYGSGLKIKSVEALTYGRSLVCTESGTLGLGGPDKVPLFVEDHGRAMADRIARLLTDSEFRGSWEKKTYAYARNRYDPDAVFGDLVNLILRHAKEKKSQ